MHSSSLIQYLYTLSEQKRLDNYAETTAHIVQYHMQYNVYIYNPPAIASNGMLQLMYNVILYKCTFPFPLSAVYIGLAPGYSQEIGNCLVFIGVGIGNAVQFFLSEYITTEANLYALLTLSVVAVHLFFVADKHFGSGSSRRSCCGRQNVENTVGRQQPVECAESTGKDTVVCMYAYICACILCIYYRVRFHWYIRTYIYVYYIIEIVA